MMIVQHHESAHWKGRVMEQFRRLHAEGADRPKICAIAIHPYISGQPHRIRFLEEIYEEIAGFEGVVHMNGAELYRWYNAAAKVHP
jgi:hypothetical protein